MEVNMGKRNLYLNNMPVDEAVAIYLTALTANTKTDCTIEWKSNDKSRASYEMIPVIQSLNRVTKEAIYAKYCSPLYNAAAMDGIAVISEKTNHASETTPVILNTDEFSVLDTGDPIHMPFDAVIMAEDLIELEDGRIQITASAAAWQHVRPIGEDIVAGEMLLASNHKIRPIDIGVLLSAGITQIQVLKLVEVAIFPTGTEMIEPTQTPKDGDIIESNSRMFEAMVKEYGGIGHRFPAIEDDYEKIKQHVLEAVERFDVVIINAGSSAGREDFTVHVLREIGEVLVHGVAIKPGKPVILAIVKGKPVIGLPGYPVAAYINFMNFVVPVMELYNPVRMQKSKIISAVLSKRLISSLKHKEYVRVKVGKVEDKIVASPLARGAGAAMSLVRADGFCIIEQNSEGVDAGEQINVELYRELEEIERTVVVIGSHDLILDVISDQMPNCYPNMYVSSTHVGSMGGLMALKRKEAHIAPIHLLDEESGAYNIPYIKKILAEPMVLIKGIHRIQGIMLKKGNPLGITNLQDLSRGSYVNRQRGAGTRILFDYKLKQLGIYPESIHGYDREATTHMAVAALVASDSADAGMGIYSAAKAMELDFIEIGSEEYDFAMPAAYLELPQIHAFIEILKSREFKERVEKLGGYSCLHTGEVIQL